MTNTTDPVAAEQGGVREMQRKAMEKSALSMAERIRKAASVRFSPSTKRAGVCFNHAAGSSWYLEDKGKVDAKLRAAVEAAYRAFNRAYYAKEAKR